LLISNNYGKHCCSLALIISEGTSSDYLQNKNPCSLAIGINAGNAIISYKGGGFQETAAKMKNLNLEIEII